MTLGNKFALVLVACGTLGAALPTQAEAFWGHRRVATAYAVPSVPVVVTSPVVVASPIVVARPVFGAPIMVARPVVSAPVVVGYAPAATFAAPTTTYYAPATAWGTPTTSYYAPTAPVMTVAPAGTLRTTTFFAPAPAVWPRRVIVNSPVIVVP